MPYITPQDTPGERDCRALLIPASSEWLAFFGGALTEFLYSYNWEQTTGISVDDTIAQMREIIDGFYEGCATSGCTLPDGSPIFRLNPVTWVVEELVDGEWVPPQGDYELPPTDARTEPTPDERICAAAANAVHVLELLYESLSDSYAEGQSTSEALAGFLAIIVGALGAVFGIVVAPLIALFAVIFATVYATVEFLTADLWTTGFTEQLICMFIACATDDGDVVHFDIDCIVGKIAEAADPTFTLDEIRLLLQVGGIMNMLGSQAIDAAGTTTAIEDADCAYCSDCIVYDFTISDAGWVADTYGTWVDGEGWQLSLNPSAIMFGFDGAPFPANVYAVDVEYYNSGGTGVMALYKNTGSYVPVTVGEPLLNGENQFRMYGVADTGTIPNLFFNANADTDAVVYIRRLTVCFL